LIQDELIIDEVLIITFCKMNDKYGSPNTSCYILNSGTELICSPTSLRYIYHSLLILNYYKSTNLRSITELGCGYGGLFLAICYFSKILNIEIDNYYIIDFPQICNLIDNYLILNKENVHINYIFNNCNEYGSNIIETNLFFISNYCFTEILDEHRNKYIENLFGKVKNGFIIWQTSFGLNIDNLNIINKNINTTIEEKPQTASRENPNYFVYF
jgi:hypothetical protein